MPISQERMNPYSHLVLASKLETNVKPEDCREYYWGAIAPDARYPAGIQRSQTHLAPEKILAFMSTYPHLKSFLQGYLVHCLADEIDLEKIFFQHIPFSFFKRQMTRRNMAISLEIYYFENEKMDQQVSGTYNEVLSELGLREIVCTKFSQSFNHYAASSSSIETHFLELFQMLGFDNDNRIEKYWKVVQGFQKNPFLITAVLFGMRTGKISEQIVHAISAKLNAK